MARIRTIKPEFFTSEDIVGLSPFARLLYIALWCEADKEGRMVWKPKTFKMRYLPGDDLDIQAMCQELIDAKLIVLYGDSYAYIPAFKAHQHINPRESDSQLPPHDASTTRGERVTTRQSPDSDAQGGREGKGREGDKPRSTRKTTLPSDFAPNETGMKKALDAGLSVERELSRFKDHHTSKGSTMLDWQAAWRTWVGNAIEFGRGKPPANDDPYGLKKAL